MPNDLTRAACPRCRDVVWLPARLLGPDAPKNARPVCLGCSMETEDGEPVYLERPAAVPEPSAN